MLDLSFNLQGIASPEPGLIWTHSQNRKVLFVLVLHQYSDLFLRFCLLGLFISAYEECQAGSANSQKVVLLDGSNVSVLSLLDPEKPISPKIHAPLFSCEPPCAAATFTPDPCALAGGAEALGSSPSLQQRSCDKCSSCERCVTDGSLLLQGQLLAMSCLPRAIGWHVLYINHTVILWPLALATWISTGC